MTRIAALDCCSSEDAWLSPESEKVGRPLRRLLTVGLELGFSTSMMESEWSLRSDALAHQFRHLAGVWREDTRYISSIHDMVLHWAYQQIIGMGRAALPLILQELKRQPDHWFWALQAITREDPVPAGDRGDMRAMARHWLRWAEGQRIARDF